MGHPGIALFDRGSAVALHVAVSGLSLPGCRGMSDRHATAPGARLERELSAADPVLA